jgi:NADPH:quinone reductase-like Zn-dependent oxidoreductase
MDGLKRDVWPKIEAGLIEPIIEARFPIEQTADAHTLMAGNDTVGKILLIV